MTYDAGWPCCAEYGIMKKRIEELEKTLTAASQARSLPKLNIRCETHDGLVHGTTYLNVVKAETDDDFNDIAIPEIKWIAHAALATYYSTKGEGG